MPINSRAKGKRGELAWAAKLRELGFASAKRGCQHAGGVDSPDVVCSELAGVHGEVKFGVGGLDLGTGLWHRAVEQAILDGGHDSRWYVAWKPTGVQQWRLTFPYDKFIVTVAGDIAIKEALLYLARLAPH